MTAQPVITRLVDLYDVPALLDGQTIVKQGGVLVASDVGTQVELDAETAARIAADTTLTAGVAAAARGLVPTAVKTANYTATPGDLVPVDTTSGSITITLPTAPADATRVAVKMIAQGGTNTVSISRGGSTDVFNKAGGATAITLTLVNQAASLQYKASTGIWYVVADDIPLSGLDSRYLTAFNVKNYGAKGDGVTDDSAAFAAAIAAAPAGSIVWVPDGTFICNSAVVVNKVIRLTGTGTIKRGSGTGDIVQLTGSSGTHLVGAAVDRLTLDGGGLVTGNGVTLTYCEYCRVEANAIKNFAAGGNAQGNGVWVQSGQPIGNKITCNTITLNTNGYGVKLQGTKGNIVAHNTVTGGQRSIQNTSEDNDSLGNLIQSNVLLSASEGEIVLSNAGGANAIRGTSIAGNTCRDGGNHGIDLLSNGTGTVEATSVVGNVCSNNAGHGIIVEVAGTGAARCNTITGNTCRANGQHGIDLYDASYTTVSSNVCENNSTSLQGGFHGIALSGTVGTKTTKTLVIGNTCTDNQGTKTQGYGICELSSNQADDNYFIANEVEGNFTGAILKSGALTTTLANKGYDVLALASYVDPLSIGAVLTVPHGSNGSTQAKAVANDAHYARIMTGGKAISKIAIPVVNASGNISVAAYTNSGVDAAARPTGGRLSTSGSVACPAAGYAEVALGGSVTVNPGDWFGMSCDNVTATFTAAGSGLTNAMVAGLAHTQGTAHPCPTTPSGLSNTASRQPFMRGIT